MPSSAKLLIAVSADFGELANSLYLLEGTQFGAHLLLPPGLYQKNRESLPHPASEYRNADELLAAVRTHRPQILLLCSGYLFGVNQLLSIAELSQIIQEAHGMGIRIHRKVKPAGISRQKLLPQPLAVFTGLRGAVQNLRVKLQIPFGLRGRLRRLLHLRHNSDAYEKYI